MLHTEQAMERVVKALQHVKKAELARRADVPESTIRDLGNPDWKPNASTLHRLEQAALEIERENAAVSASPSPQREAIAQ